MKRFLIILATLISAIPAISQHRGEITVLSGSDISHEIGDSLQYILPQFSVGTVTFEDGTRNQVLLNICTFDQGIRFIENGTGDTLAVADEKSVESVFVNRRYFLKHNGYQYFEVLFPMREHSLAVCRSLQFMEPAKEGAFGTKSHTSSSTSYYNYADYSNGKIYRLDNYLDVPWKYEIDVYIKTEKKFLPSTLKNFKKAYPKELSSFIEQYVKENNLKLDKFEDANNLYEALQRRIE